MYIYLFIHITRGLCELGVWIKSRYIVIPDVVVTCMTYRNGEGVYLTGIKHVRSREFRGFSVPPAYECGSTGDRGDREESGRGSGSAQFDRPWPTIIMTLAPHANGSRSFFPLERYRFEKTPSNRRRRRKPVARGHRLRLATVRSRLRLKPP